MNEAKETEQMQRFSHAVNRLRTRPRDLNGEPAFAALIDPPGKALVHAYRETLPPAQQHALCYADVPPLDQRPTGAVWLLKALLHAWDDPEWDKREAGYRKEIRLKDLLKQRQAALVIMADIHHLAHATRPFDHLLSLFQTEQMMPLLIVGESSGIITLLNADERFLWRFPRLYFE